jgi:hypothetical protein
MQMQILSDNQQGSNKARAPRFHPFQNVAQIVSKSLICMGEPVVVAEGDRQFHQAEAMRSAKLVGTQYTAEAKKQAKRECLGHLIASLAVDGLEAAKGPSL